MASDLKQLIIPSAPKLSYIVQKVELIELPFESNEPRALVAIMVDGAWGRSASLVAVNRRQPGPPILTAPTSALLGRWLDLGTSIGLYECTITCREHGVDVPGQKLYIRTVQYVDA